MCEMLFPNIHVSQVGSGQSPCHKGPSYALQPSLEETFLRAASLRKGLLLCSQSPQRRRTQLLEL